MLALRAVPWLANAVVARAYTSSMEPDIRYATTSDGVSIAYWTMGEGEPLLMLQPPPFNNIEREWHEWEFHRLVARNPPLIRYDCRGSGASPPNAVGFSAEGVLHAGGA